MNFNRSAKKKMSFERFLSYEYADDYLAGFHKPVIRFLVHRGRCILHLPVLQKAQIITKHPLTVSFVIAKLICHRVPGFCKRSSFRRLIRVDAEILCDFLRSLIGAEVKQPCSQVDHIAFRSASEAVIEVRIELEAWEKRTETLSTGEELNKKAHAQYFAQYFHKN